MFCKHDWNVLSESVTESKFQVYIKVLNGVVKGKVIVPDHFMDLCRKHIVIVSCKKCGKLKRFVEDI